MRKMVLFMMVSLDGYFEGPNHDLGWHNVDEEFSKFTVENINESDTLLFGRRTYELMASFWPKHVAKKGDKYDAIVTSKMNNLPKVVFSRTLKTVEESKNWKNITLIKGNIAEEIMKLKRRPGKKLAVLGSSNLCVTMLRLGLLDELRIMVNPVAIGAGTPLFKGIEDRFAFKLLKTRAFKSGNVLLYYKPLEKR